MLSDFKDLFTTYCADGLTQTYLELDDVVEEFELNELVDDLEQIQMNASLYDQFTVADMIHSKIVDQLHAMLNDHNIFLTDEATVSEIVTIAECLRLIKNWDAPDAILAITCQDDISDEEKLAEMCAVVGTCTPERYLGLIDSVGDGIIDRIAELYEPDTPQVAEPDPTVMAYIPVLRRLFAFVTETGGIEPSSLRSFQLLKAGMNPGAPFRFYFDMIRQHFTDQVSNVDQTAADLLTLLSMSEDSSGDVTTAWQRESEYIYSSLDAIQAVGIAMKNLNNKYLAWQAANPEPSI